MDACNQEAPHKDDSSPSLTLATTHTGPHNQQSYNLHSN